MEGRVGRVSGDTFRSCQKKRFNLILIHFSTLGSVSLYHMVSVLQGDKVYFHQPMNTLKYDSFFHSSLIVGNKQGALHRHVSTAAWSGEEIKCQVTLCDPNTPLLNWLRAFCDTTNTSVALCFHVEMQHPLAAVY